LSDHGGLANLARTGDDNHEPWHLAKALSQDGNLASLEGHFYQCELIYSQH
jgi:hypothetical protein